MSKILVGIIGGIIFGGVAVATMLPIPMTDKKTAMLGAFANRFAVGFAIGAANLPLPGWLSGLLLALIISLPDAIITKAWAPIMVLGAIGGILIGVAVGAWGV